jgi:hypothetical protein
MSSSSTTTSDIRRSPNPRIHAWIRGFRPSRGGSIGPDSAGIPQEIRSRCRLMPISGSQLNHDLGGDPEFAWADLADSIEDHTIVTAVQFIIGRGGSGWR